ncbi:MAG TPA: pseudouridine synthase [Nitriliruptorales bacterium]
MSDGDDEGAGSSPERLQKILAAAGVASRRASEDLIRQGRVTVDGRVATVGDKADPTAADVRVDGERINVHPERLYVMLNKPRGVVTTSDDPQGRPTVVDLVNLSQRLFPVGRLDIDTEGLLLLTNDGELAHKLMHPSYEVPRVYVALINGALKQDTLAHLRAGVELEDGLALPSSVRVLDEGRDKTLLEIVLAEGRNREVRRMVAAVGLRLERLARVAYAGVPLGELRQGKWRFLTQREVSRLYESTERQTDVSTYRRNDTSRSRGSGRRAGPNRSGARRGRGGR